MRRAWSVLVLAGGAASCAGSSVVARSFERSDLAEAPLRSVSLWVEAAAPTSLGDGTWAEVGFPPPPDEGSLRAERPSRPLGAELGARVRERLAALGHAVVETASRADTLAEARAAAAGSDALVVVRAVPVDEFVLEIPGAAVAAVPDEDRRGRGRARTLTTERRTGRVWVGQVFVLEPSTGARLWSRQAPGLPPDGRVPLGHPFLANGVVAELEPELVGAALERASIERFVSVLLSEFPARQDGRPGWVPDRREERDLAFFDRAHVSLDAGGGYGAETVGLGLGWFDVPLDELDAAAVLGPGLPRVRARVGYVDVSRWLVRVGGTFGFPRGEFGRAYREDVAGRPVGRAARVTVRAPSVIGAEVDVGRLLAAPLTSGGFWLPRAGVFAERWAFEVTPELGEATDRLRAGVLLGWAAWLRSADGGWFGELGLELRAGGDTSGRLLIGGGLTLAVGALL